VALCQQNARIGILRILRQTLVAQVPLVSQVTLQLVQSGHPLPSVSDGLDCALGKRFHNLSFFVSEYALCGGIGSDGGVVMRFAGKYTPIEMGE
jgi:hypothetical protein